MGEGCCDTTCLIWRDTGDDPIQGGVKDVGGSLNSVDTIENPSNLPHWEAVIGRSKKDSWKGKAGTLYWHPTHKFNVVGRKKVNRVGFRRACGGCNKMMKGVKESHCRTCLWNRQVWEQRDESAKTAKTAKTAETPSNLPHWEAVIGRSKKDVAAKEVASRRNAQRPSLDLLMAKQNIEEWPGFKLAKPSTRYAALNQKDGYAPYVVVLIGGTQLARACEDTSCCNVAQQNPDTKEYKWCIQHGGGRRCKGLEDGSRCPLGRSVNKKNDKDIWYGGRCVRCFCDSFPNDPLAINAKRWLNTREQTVVEVLKQAFPNHAWSLNKGFATGILQRPDMRINANRRRILLVEVDEDSHRSYSCAKERVREATFFTNAPLGATIVMLRFNPDSYTDLNGVKHPSCFRFNADSGVTIVDPKQRGQWKARCETLIAAVENYLDPETEVPPPQADRVIFSQELFYDDISGAPLGNAERARAKLKRLRLLKRLESTR